MVQPVLRGEADARKHDSVFADRQIELEESAANMPKGVHGDFPYLMEITTGHIHPYSKALAERSDLVVGCYNLQGSFDASDADPHYDPQGVYAANERRARVQTVAPQTAAERKAAEAAAHKRLRAEIEVEVRAQLEAEYGPEVQAAESEPVAAPKKPRKKPAAVQAAPVAEPVEAPQPVADNNITDVVGDGADDLDAAFEDAMRG